LNESECAQPNKSRPVIKDLLDKVELSIKYDLLQSREKGVAVLKTITENKSWLFDEESCLRLLKIVEDAVICPILWPCIQKKLATKHLRSASAEALLGNPLSRDLLMLFLIHNGVRSSS
jgi:hypothetical protein